MASMASLQCSRWCRWSPPPKHSVQGRFAFPWSPYSFLCLLSIFMIPFSVASKFPPWWLLRMEFIILVMKSVNKKCGIFRVQVGPVPKPQETTKLTYLILVIHSVSSSLFFFIIIIYCHIICYNNNIIESDSSLLYFGLQYCVYIKLKHHHHHHRAPRRNKI